SPLPRAPASAWCLASSSRGGPARRAWCRSRRHEAPRLRARGARRLCHCRPGEAGLQDRRGRRLSGGSPRPARVAGELHGAAKRRGSRPSRRPHRRGSPRHGDAEAGRHPRPRRSRPHERARLHPQPARPRGRVRPLGRVARAAVLVALHPRRRPPRLLHSTPAGATRRQRRAAGRARRAGRRAGGGAMGPRRAPLAQLHAARYSSRGSGPRGIRPRLPRRALSSRKGDGPEPVVRLHADHHQLRLRGARLKLARAISSVISMLLLVASPFFLYFTLSQRRIALAASMLVGWVAIRALAALLAAQPAQRAAALRLPAIALVFALLGWAFDSDWMLLI